jgi:TRAP-type C4-dicarboxylate transport system permease small subunit
LNLVAVGLKKIAKTIELIQFWSCVAIVTFLTAVTVVQVFCRFVLNSPITWVQEISTCLLIWLTFLGAGVLTNRNQHIRVDILFDKFPNRVKWVVDLFLNLSILVFAVYLINLSIDLYELQSVTPVGVLELPRTFYFALPVLVFSLSVPIYTLEKIFSSLVPRSVKEEETNEQNIQKKESTIWS